MMAWSIQKRNTHGRLSGPLGLSWVTPPGTVLPPGVLPWPALYATRREARLVAAAQTSRFAYLKDQRWHFRAVRLRVTHAMV